MELAIFFFQIVFGLLIADFISGLFHWLEDTYGNEDWPMLGPYVIEPNIRHHLAPLDFTRSTYLVRNRVVIVLALMFGIIFWSVDWLNTITLTALVFGSQANETHRWAHLPSRRVPCLVIKLEQLGIFLSRRQHRLHHRRPFDSHYCTITNFTNPLLDKLNIFRGIEVILKLLCGVTPRDDSE